MFKHLFKGNNNTVVFLRLRNSKAINIREETKDRVHLKIGF